MTEITIEFINKILTNDFNIDKIDITHIGYTTDSLVYSFDINNDKYIAKCIDSNTYEFKILMDISNLENNTILSSPIKIIHNITDKTHLVIFKRYDCDLYYLDKICIKNKYEDLWLNLGTDLINGINIMHKNLHYSHGDLKPLNICIDKCKLKIIDFGTSTPILLSCNKYHSKNTFFWFTPLQFIKLIKNDFWTIKEIQDKVIEKYKANITEIDSIIHNKYKTLFVDKNNPNFYFENPIKNDWFICGLLLIYIYTPDINFWLAGSNIEYNYYTMTLDESFNIIINNMKSFLLNPIKTVDDFLINYGSNIPNKYKDIIKNYLLSILE